MSSDRPRCAAQSEPIYEASLIGIDEAQPHDFNAVPVPAQSEANPGEGPRPGDGFAGRMAAPER